MGNYLSNKNSDADSEASLMLSRCLMVFRDSKASCEERQAAFTSLQNEYARILSNDEYSLELTRVFGLRYNKWSITPPTNASSLSDTELADRIRGCIFGAALGDATGVATEFMSVERVDEAYCDDFEFGPGVKVFPDSHRMMFPHGDWTDDTDQLLLILQTFLENDGRPDVVKFGQKLKHWKEHGFAELGDRGGAGLGKTTKRVIMRSNFDSDPVDAARCLWIDSEYKISSNGCVMRTAITGVPSFWDLDVVEKNTKQFCTATHADPRCIASCSVVSTTISRMLQGQAPHNALNDSIKAAECHLVSTVDAHIDLPNWSIEFYRYTGATSVDELELSNYKDGIGYSLKCLGAGVWALKQVQQADFKSIITAIVRAGGDADTNATVAGALVGTAIGFSQLPQDWLSGMPYSSWLEAWVQKILFMLDLPVRPRSNV